jgi:ankyrin repeat protein
MARAATKVTGKPVARSTPAAKAKPTEPPDYDGWTDLHWAASKGKTAQVEALLREGASVDAANGMRRTPLYEAAKRGHVETVRVLVKNGAAINGVDPSGFTPLHVAGEHRRLDVMRVLLDAGADVHARNRHGQTPLWQASWQSWHEDAAVARLLLQHGATPQEFAHSGWAPIHMAAGADFQAFVQLMLEHGADPNMAHATTPSWGPLHAAAKRGALRVIALLLDRGADIDLHGSETGKTPLLVAMSNRQDAATKLLLERGADVNARPITEMPPLSLAVFQKRNGLVRELLRRGANVDARTKGWSALQIAEHEKNAEAVALLRAARAEGAGE